jgi:hypothetical protein
MLLEQVRDRVSSIIHGAHRVFRQCYPGGFGLSSVFLLARTWAAMLIQRTRRSPSWSWQSWRKSSKFNQGHAEDVGHLHEFTDAPRGGPVLVTAPPHSTNAGDSLPLHRFLLIDSLAPGLAAQRGKARPPARFCPVADLGHDFPIMISTLLSILVDITQHDRIR